MAVRVDDYSTIGATVTWRGPTAEAMTQRGLTKSSYSKWIHGRTVIPRSVHYGPFCPTRPNTSNTSPPFHGASRNLKEGFTPLALTVNVSTCQLSSLRPRPVSVPPSHFLPPPQQPTLQQYSPQMQPQHIDDDCPLRCLLQSDQYSTSLPPGALHAQSPNNPSAPVAHSYPSLSPGPILDHPILARKAIGPSLSVHKPWSNHLRCTCLPSIESLV